MQYFAPKGEIAPNNFVLKKNPKMDHYFQNEDNPKKEDHPNKADSKKENDTKKEDDPKNENNPKMKIIPQIKTDENKTKKIRFLNYDEYLVCIILSL